VIVASARVRSRRRSVLAGFVLALVVAFVARPLAAAWYGGRAAPRSQREGIGRRLSAHLSRGTAGGPAERAAFGARTSYAVTILTSRVVNHVRERQRAFPRARSILRRASSPRQRTGARVHHFVPGIAIGFATGATAILTHRMSFSLSLPFGSGVAHTVDELPLLFNQRNPYWGSESFAIAHGVVTAAIAAALAARFTGAASLGGQPGGPLKAGPRLPSMRPRRRPRHGRGLQTRRSACVGALGKGVLGRVDAHTLAPVDPDP
jgi:hypothetical protein